MKTRLIVQMSIVMLLILIVIIRILNKNNQEIEGYINILDKYHQSILEINQNISQIEQIGKINRDFIEEQFLMNSKKNAHADSIFISHIAVYRDSIKKWMPRINRIIKDTCPPSDIVYTDTNRIYYQSANLQVGENNQFVIAGQPGDKIGFCSTKNSKISLVQGINNKGELIDINEEISQKLIFLKYPINIFQITSTLCSQDTLIISSTNKSDTIISCFQPSAIQYQLTHHIIPDTEGYNIILSVTFSDEVVQDIKTTLSVSIEINSQIKMITENVLIPAGTTEYKKEIPYKILGRHPYHFDIKNVSLPIESNNNIIYHAAN